MATVDRTTAEEIVAGKYKSDKPNRIVRYNNVFNGGEAFGVTFGKQSKQTYFEGGACLNPVVYWDIEDGYGKPREGV